MKNYVLLFKKNNLTTKYTHEGLVQAYRNDTDRSIKAINVSVVDTHKTPEEMGLPNADSVIDFGDNDFDTTMRMQLKTLAHQRGLVPDEKSIWCIFTLKENGPGDSPGTTNMQREMIETSLTEQDYH